MKILVFDDMSQCTEQEVARLLPLVSAQRREQALRYKHTLGQFCCLKSWLMVQEIMGNDAWRTKAWQYNEHGKPYLENGPYFSISHCKEGIAVAVDEQPIGIDIEGIRHASADLIERVLSEDERLKVKGEWDKDRAFTRLWTQKEAVVKMEGTGIESFEQLQQVLLKSRDHETTGLRKIETFESEKYIYSIAQK
ncbi:MAG: 4'-phosphopantetheinyl transferase superfamily protein [Paludibacteraceae bacterium]|nr:4'-phosphopantetheinyl transferase superfamily protein [Paludibacteraceae bacterium]